MGKIGTALKLAKGDKDLFLAQLIQHFAFLFGDKAYLRLVFRFRMGYKLNLKTPRTFNEKLNWLKIYDHNPLYTRLVDKYEVKSFVTQQVGSECVIPTIGVWDTPEAIDFESLPRQFVLKTTHGGGNTGVLICRDKSGFDKHSALKMLHRAMKQDLYTYSREWPYKNVSRRLIAEPYIEDKMSGELRDYKFFCFDGQVRALFVATERQHREEPFFNFFDADFNPLPVKQGHPVSNRTIEKPSTFETMKEVAATLSKGMAHVRIDLYEANGQVLFGEMTFYHFGGVVPFEPPEWDYIFGEWIHLCNVNQ